MGKGTIQSGGTDGEYSVEVELDTDTIDDEIDDLDDKISDLDTRIAAAEEGLDKDILELRRTAMQKRKEYLQDPENVPVSPTETVWCADLTEDLSGSVGVIEVAGVRGKGFNIQPGYEGNAVYDDTRDGIIKPAIAVKAAETYFNWAMQGGWQKWKPTYRYGTISELDQNVDTCTVTFEAETNDDTGLDINQTTSLSDVAIEYMDCNAAAFENGDEVIVKFEDNDWSTPKVIGFKEEPKGCYGYGLIVSGSYVTVWDFSTNAVAVDIPLNGGGVATFPCLSADISDWTDAVEEWEGWEELFTEEPDDGSCGIIWETSGSGWEEKNASRVGALGTHEYYYRRDYTNTFESGGEGTGYWEIWNSTNIKNESTAQKKGILLTALNGSAEEIALAMAYSQSMYSSYTYYLYVPPESVWGAASCSESSTETNSRTAEQDYFESLNDNGSKACARSASVSQETSPELSWPYVSCTEMAGELVCTGSLGQTLTNISIGNCSYFHQDMKSIFQIFTAKDSSNYKSYGTSDIGLEDVAVAPSTLGEKATLSAAVLALIQQSTNYSVSVSFKI